MRSVGNLAKEYVISFFDRSLSLFGDRPESLRWTAEGQLTRYESLLGIAASIVGSKVLDFGCGKGDFYGFLKDRHIPVHYTGYDINNGLISLAARKYPDAGFRTFDIENDRIAEDFDYIFLCGVFNLEVQGIDELIGFTLTNLFSHCRIGLGFNALSAGNPDRDFELHYIAESEIFSFAARELSNDVVVRPSGMPYDFTMFVYRDGRNSVTTPPLISRGDA